MRSQLPVDDVIFGKKQSEKTLVRVYSRTSAFAMEKTSFRHAPSSVRSGRRCLKLQHLLQSATPDQR